VIIIMDTKRNDETTTIAITIDIRNRLKKLKIIEAESWNNVVNRILTAFELEQEKEK